MFCRCPYCGVTEISISDLALAPSDGGDAWLIQLECFRHAFINKILIDFEL
jgi:hypothetical protein